MEEDEVAAPKLVPVALDRLGVAELHRYIDTLRREIARAEEEIAAKQTHKSAADGLFTFR